AACHMVAHDVAADETDPWQPEGRSIGSNEP
ncbi:hypothetical protein D3OALGB2SA_1118, partial [Olavius algarvensis associated proteobacterium Delta 3]